MTERRAFVIVSISDRVEQLNALVASIRALGRFAAYDLCLYFQDPAGVRGRIEHRDRYAAIFYDDELRGCHAARIELLRRITYHTYVNLDDDVRLTPHTWYSAAARKAAEPGTGFVLTNWARTPALYQRKIAAIRPDFVRQVMIYQGGGMVYTDKIATLMRGLDPEPATFDAAWPLTAYTHGYLNYRYLGSLAIHQVCGAGGMRTYLDANPPQLTRPDMINYRWAKRRNGTGRDVLIPLDTDLRPAAHEAHRLSRAALGLTDRPRRRA